MINQIPEELRPFLELYLHHLKNSFANKLSGVYLYGAIAMGYFNKENSDIDLVTVFSSRLNQEEIKILENIHKYLEEGSFPVGLLDVMYLAESDIGKLNSDIEPYPVLEGNSFRTGYHNINAVTWWTMKIPLYGPKIEINVEWQEIVKAMNYNVNVYWINQAKLAKKHLEQGGILGDKEIEWSILTLCRIVYTLEKKDYISKDDSAVFALTFFEDKWQAIITEALRIRLGVDKKSLYLSKKERSLETVEFLLYTINFCNEAYSLKNN